MLPVHGAFRHAETQRALPTRRTDRHWPSVLRRLCLNTVESPVKLPMAPLAVSSSTP